jgi:hypothetical protein
MFLIVIICMLLLFTLYGIHYVNGMAIYAKYNNTPSSEENRYTIPEVCWDSVRNESNELIDAIVHLEFFNIILEGSDVIHALIKYFIIKLLPKKIYCDPVCWIPIFFIVPFATIKLGIRYKRYKCIRNHGNKNNCNHTCYYKYE